MPPSQSFVPSGFISSTRNVSPGGAVLLVMLGLFATLLILAVANR